MDTIDTSNIHSQVRGEAPTILSRNSVSDQRRDGEHLVCMAGCCWWEGEFRIVPMVLFANIIL